MNNLPTGTVTFLFTDIEGSTKLAQQYPEDMPARTSCLMKVPSFKSLAIELVLETADDIK